tara:strand:+ start:206 stop:1507 length:1302 start_codon:yes stop_codon:yes gene_type:complete
MSKNNQSSEKQKLDYLISLYNKKNFLEILEINEKIIDEYPDNLHIKNLFALTLKSVGRFEDSKKAFHEIIKNNIKNPEIAYVYTNTANLYYDIGQINSAITFHEAAIQLNPEAINSYLGLGLAFSNQGDNEKAVNFFSKGLDLKNEDENLNYNMAMALRKLERYREASNYYSKTNMSLSNSYKLECLYLDLDKETKFEEFENFLKDINARNHYNPLIASISEHSSIRFKKENECNFCKQPFNYIRKFNLYDNEMFNEELIDQILIDFESSNNSKKTQSLLNNGFQSSGNLFNLESKSIQKLKKIIEEKVLYYRNLYKDSNDGFIKNWPKNYTLYGWLIIMNEGGNLSSHIHKEGWLSSSIYLKRPKKIQKNDGDLKFSLHGGNFVKGDGVFPEETLEIYKGEMVLFPSSVFHSTIPFESNEQRITLAFDILPK